MRNTCIIFSVLFLLVACKNDSEKSLIPTRINTFKVAFTNQTDTLINLKNGMQLKIKKGTFDTDSPITLKYTPILSAKDFIANKVSTLTSDGRQLRTVGMVKIQFFDQQGNEVYPQKNYTLLSKKGITSKDVKFFYGSKQKGHVVWNEFKNKTYKVEFVPYYYVLYKESTAGKGVDIILSNNDTLYTFNSLSSYLTHLYEDSLYANPIICRINCKLNKETRNITVQSIKWISKPNRQFGAEIREILKNRQIKITLSYPFVNWSIITVKDKTKYLSKLRKNSKILQKILKRDKIKSKSSSNKVKDRFVIKTKRVGWLNYDIYAKGLMAYFVADSKKDLYIISKEEDCGFFPYSVHGTVQKFRIILNDSVKKMNLFYVKDRKITKKRTIKLVRNDTLFITG